MPEETNIIGGMFESVYPDADAKHALAGVSAYRIAARIRRNL
jgi:hypothetical protein